MAEPEDLARPLPVGKLMAAPGSPEVRAIGPFSGGLTGIHFAAGY